MRILNFTIAFLLVSLAVSCDLSEKDFIEAAKKNDVNIIKEYLKSGGNINTSDNLGRSALEWSILNNNEDSARFLIEKGADYHSVLFSIVRGGYSSAFDLLASMASLDYDLKDKYGNTLLHAAAEGNVEVLEKILNHSPDVNPQNHSSETPLFIAAGTGNYEIVKLLLKKKANKDILDKFGRSATMVAEAGHYYKIVELLKN